MVFNKIIELFVKVKDSVSGVTVKITPAGQMYVATVPEAPPDTTPIRRTGYSSVAGHVDNVYLITSGKNLVIQTAAYSGEASVDGSRVEFWHDPSGNYIDVTDLSTLTNFELLFVGFLNGDGGQIDGTERKFLGDGTGQIVMRRERLGGGAKWIFGKWVGYES